jgi:hypothetical protein
MTQNSEETIARLEQAMKDLKAKDPHTYKDNLLQAKSELMELERLIALLKKEIAQ